ncbi:MAG: hypothetical protein ACLQU1_05305 [Bryobacteraceae bacterium]
MQNRRLLAISLLATAAALWPQDSKPNLSGRWVMNAAKSTGRNPKTCEETIDHKEPALTITTVSEDPRGQSKSFLKLTTDGRDSVNEVNGNEFHSKSHWEAAKLVTVVTGDRGLTMTEVRSLSADGKTQTVESFMGPSPATPMSTRLMEKQ